MSTEHPTDPPERIPLHGRGGVIRAHVLIDAADAAIAAYRWSFDSGTSYAVRTIDLPPTNGRRRQRKLYLHRELLGLTLGDGLEADHIDGNKMDCRRSNLRLGTHAQNAQNVPARGGASKHRGVSWQRRARDSGVWQAKGRLHGQQRHLGYFKDEGVAAEVAAAFRREHSPFANEARSIAR